MEADAKNMKNLRRALWMTLKYKWSLIGSFVCCLFVAVLWGANPVSYTHLTLPTKA